VKKLKRLPEDRNKLAHEIVRMSTEEPEDKLKEQPNKERSPISEYLAEIGRKGGLKGGKIRAQRLTPKRRKEIARQAAQKRWEKKDD
jgi:hypothetical protein